MGIYPITFSIPNEKIINKISTKSKFISNLIPGKKETYIYNTEKDYYEEYQKSIFAITTSKGGWDCLRHYEILANGCIPYFPNIGECPPNIMKFLPKDLINYGNNLYEGLKNKNINQLTQSEKNKCLELSQILLEYTKNNLSTLKITEYVLNQSNLNPKSILFLTANSKPDYLFILILIGFKEKFGKNCHENPYIPYIYKNNNDYSNLYGKGFSYTNIIPPNDRDNKLDNTLLKDINSKKYDIVIYGSMHRGLPYYKEVSRVYKPNEIIMFCGEDNHDCGNKYTSDDHRKFSKIGHHIFVRELYAYCQ